MSTTKTIKSFVKQFLAVLKGDSDKATAEKVFRQAQSALKTQINNGDGDQIDLEEKVKAAEEKLALAVVNNGQLISERSTYVQNLLTSKNSLTTAENELKKHKEKLEFLKEQLAGLEQDVEADEEAA